MLIELPLVLEPTDTLKPSITLKQVRYDQKANAPGEISVLPYYFSNLRFDFIAFSYRSGKKLRYAYRMVGLDSSWTYTSFDHPYVIYPSLPSGNYTYQVKAITERQKAGWKAM